MATKRELAEAIMLMHAEYDDMKPIEGPRLDMWWEALKNFPDGVIRASVTRYLMANHFKPQLADIVEGCARQLDGNWLGAEEAWALAPKHESDSAMLTAEISEALAAAQPLIDRRDLTAARMAFKETYGRLVERAKIEGRMPAYFASFGSDAERRATMLAGAVQKGQVTLEYAVRALPEYGSSIARMVGVTNHPLLAAPSEESRAKIKQALSMLRLGHE